CVDGEQFDRVADAGRIFLGVAGEFLFRAFGRGERQSPPSFAIEIEELEKFGQAPSHRNPVIFPFRGELPEACEFDRYSGNLQYVCGRFNDSQQITVSGAISLRKKTQ